MACNGVRWKEGNAVDEGRPGSVKSEGRSAVYEKILDEMGTEVIQVKGTKWRRQMMK